MTATLRSVTRTVTESPAKKTQAKPGPARPANAGDTLSTSAVRPRSQQVTVPQTLHGNWSTDTLTAWRLVQSAARRHSEMTMYDDPDYDDVPGWWFVLAPAVGLALIALVSWWLWG